MSGIAYQQRSSIDKTGSIHKTHSESSHSNPRKVAIALTSYPVDIGLESDRLARTAAYESLLPDSRTVGTRQQRPAV
jgi:hypothetical protein